MRYKDSIRQKRYERQYERHGAGRGIIVLLVGVFLLLQNLHLKIAEWIISWQMLLIVIGLYVYFRSECKNVGGLIMIAVGGIFMAREYFFLPYDIDRFLWPGLLIIIGLLLITFRPNRNKYKEVEAEEIVKEIPDVYPLDEDYVNTTVIFSGENRLIVSKKFRGGKIAAIFGGCDINMLQADFEGVIEIEVECIFGGAELIVPSNWEVKVNTSSVFGGVEDKRPVELIGTNPNKVHMIKGNCVFGGIEIKSYT